MIKFSFHFYLLPISFLDQPEAEEGGSSATKKKNKKKKKASGEGGSEEGENKGEAKNILFLDMK